MVGTAHLTNIAAKLDVFSSSFHPFFTTFRGLNTSQKICLKLKPTNVTSDASPSSLPKQKNRSTQNIMSILVAMIHGASWDKPTVTHLTPPPGTCYGFIHRVDVLSSTRSMTPPLGVVVRSMVDEQPLGLGRKPGDDSWSSRVPRKFMLDTSYLIDMGSNKKLSRWQFWATRGWEPLHLRQGDTQPKRPCRWQGKFPSVADGWFPVQWLCRDDYDWVGRVGSSIWGNFPRFHKKWWLEWGNSTTYVRT